MKKKNFLKNAVILILCFGSLTFLSGCGRSPSRYLGKDHRQVLSIPSMKEFVSLSYDYRDGSTKKDVTFLADDGYYYTQEFKDASPLEGIIRWIPYGQDESFWRSRSISRWTGTPVNLKLPEDFKEMLGVSVTKSSNGSTKMLTYRSNDGMILSKEYRDGVIDRNFEGWLEVKRAD